MTILPRTLWFETPGTNGPSTPGDKADNRTILTGDELLRRPESLVVLGEPGMGKTVLLESLAAATGSPKFSARRFSGHPNPVALVGAADPILIDGLDELAATRDGDAVDQILRRLEELPGRRFILSCRVADWRAAMSMKAFRELGSGPPLQVHLEPLTSGEQLAFLAERVGPERAEEVLDHFRARRLDFLGNPQTLVMVVAIAGQNAPLPERRGELFQNAIDQLWQEHKEAATGKQLSRQEALDAAGAACAALILTGNEVIARKPSANAADGELLLSELDAFSPDAISRVLGTRLFVGRGDDRFTYMHRRIGEFLAAAWLSRRADTPEKRRRLLRLLRSSGLVPASLRGLHAWLVRDPVLAPDVIAADPIGVMDYGDATDLTSESRRTLLAALRQLADADPDFHLPRGLEAPGLGYPDLHQEVDGLLRDPAASFSLRLLLVEQLADAQRAAPYRQTLRSLLMDETEFFALRRRAGDALATLEAEDWTADIEALRCQGDENGTRLAYELMKQVGLSRFTDEEVVGVLLAYDGLTIASIARHRVIGSSLMKFWSFADIVPEERLDDLLTFLSEELQVLLPRSASPHDYQLIRLARELIAQRLKVSVPVDPLRLWGWLLPPVQRHLNDYHDDVATIAAWFRSHDEARREIQRHVLLDAVGPGAQIGAPWLLQSELGLSANEADIIALLGKLDPDDRSDGRWTRLLFLIRHDGDEGRAARETARPFAAHDPALQAWLTELAVWRKPQWMIDDEAKKARREKARAHIFSRQRRDFEKDISLVRAGEFGFVRGPAMAYLGQCPDLNNDLSAHERIVEWLGPDVADAAHAGFEAFLQKSPPRPTAAEVAKSLAEGKAWNTGVILVAGLAERLRTASSPFDGLSDECLMAGLFELWHRRWDVPAGLPDLLSPIESEIRYRGLYERSARLYIEPQLERRRDLIDHLYALMRSDADVALAAELALEWLTAYPDLPVSVERELVDRILRTPKRDDLRAFCASRCANIDDEHRRLWQAVGILVDFDTAVDQLGAEVVPDLLWELRDRGNRGRLEDLPAISLSSAQLFWIIRTFRPAWPNAPHPLGGTSGTQSPWDATDYLRGLMARLAEDTSEEAIAALTALRDAPGDGYTSSLQSLVREQRQKRAEGTYRSPGLEEIRTILEAGLPATAADLQATTLENLQTVQKMLCGSSVDWYRGFFKDDRRTHKKEEDCRDELIKMLTAVDGRFKYEPEGHVADNREVDVVVHASGRLLLPIEIKGEWNDEIWTAADTQLDRLYVNDWRAERGIYLVLWFGGRDLMRAPGSKSKPVTPEALRAELIASSKAARDGRVDVVVLDLTRPQ